MNNIIAYKNRSIDYNSPVYIYRNLNCKNVSYSILQKNLVVAHTDSLTLKNVNFIVRKAGKDKAIKTNHRNVHAFIHGYIYENNIEYNPNLKIKYNPFIKKGFYLEKKNIKKISKNKKVIINKLGVFFEKK